MRNDHSNSKLTNSELSTLYFSYYKSLQFPTHLNLALISVLSYLKTGHLTFLK